MYDVQRYYRTVAPYIDAELAHRGDEPFWCALGCRYRAGSILELGCGSGRVTALLAAAGARVTGIDVSPDLLARARAQVEGLPVSLLLADMRRLPFRARFDLVVAPDDPFSHLLSDADRLAALRMVAAHLADGGRFVLDALWFSPDRERRGASPQGFTAAHDLEAGGRTVRVTEHWTCSAETHRCSAEYDYDGDAGRPAHAAFEARYWTSNELDAFLAAAGLRPLRRWGDYDRRAWAPRSPRLVVEAQHDRLGCR